MKKRNWKRKKIFIKKKPKKLSKMVTKLKNLKKRKNCQEQIRIWQRKKNIIKKNTEKIVKKKILGAHNSTRALQSTPFPNPGGIPWAWQRRKDGNHCV